MGLKVEIEALRADAKVWDKASEDLVDPTREAGNLTLDGGQDFADVGVELGVDKTYEKLRGTIESLLAEATDYFAELAATLRDVADLYEKQEADGSEDFDDTGDDLEED